MLSSLRDFSFDGGMTEDFVTWCDHNHLKLNINRTSELVVDYQNRMTHILAVIQMEAVK